MDVPRDPARLDWLVELGGAAEPAAAAGFAGLKLAPMLGVPVGAAIGIAAVPVFALAYLAMLWIEPEPRKMALGAFALEPIEEWDELLLDDVLEATEPDSRVVSLFKPEAVLTAGQLKARIDRHLVVPERPAPAPDASDALYQALADLRRLLR